MPVRSLSATEARIVLTLEERKQDEVSLDTIQSYGGVGRAFARKLAHGLVRKGWLQRVGRAKYLLNPVTFGPDALPDTDPFRVGSRIVRPYYFGYATAAELWGFALQLGRIYYVVTPTRTSVHLVHAGRFRIVRVHPRRFFGIDQITRRTELLNVSDPERTVIDCISRPELAGGMGGAVQILARAKPRLRWTRLSRYLRKLGNRSASQRVGFLAEQVRLSTPTPRSWWSGNRPHDDDPWVPLGPPRTFGRQGPRDARWHVIRNVPDSILFAEGNPQ